MPDTSTEVAIATTTLGSTAGSITFSSIPNTYTDLRVVLTYTTSVSAANVFWRFNSDTASNYSYTRLFGSGTTAGSDNGDSINRIQIDTNTSSTITQFQTCDIFSYTASVNKTALLTSQEDNNGSGYVLYGAGLWRNTSVINSITMFCNGANFAVGTTATLYGIL